MMKMHQLLYFLLVAHLLSAVDRARVLRRSPSVQTHPVETSRRQSLDRRMDRETHPVETEGEMDRDSSCWKSAGKMRRMFSGVADSLKATEEETLLR